MESTKKNTSLETFAWLIHKEVDRYVNEHLSDYEKWVKKQSAVCKQECDDKTQDSNIQSSKSA